MNIHLHFISFLFSTVRSHKELRSFIVENEDQFSMHTRFDPVAKAPVTLYRDPTTWHLRFDFFQRALESPENTWNCCKILFIFHEMEMSRRPYGDLGLSTERAGRAMASSLSLSWWIIAFWRSAHGVHVACKELLLQVVGVHTACTACPLRLYSVHKERIYKHKHFQTIAICNHSVLQVTSTSEVMAGKRGNKGKGKKMVPSWPTEPRERTPSPAPLQVEEKQQQAEQEPPSMVTSEETSQPSSRSSSRPQSPSVWPSKKAKTFTDLTTNQEDDMASWLEVNELIYNKKLNAYKDFRKKDILWELKAAELDKDTAVLKTWYRSIRTRYTRLVHMKSGDVAS